MQLKFSCNHSERQTSFDSFKLSHDQQPQDSEWSQHNSMAQIEKLLKKLLSKPNDFTWDELVKILGHFGYEEMKKGKTGGSRRKFVNKDHHIISLHKPHPGNTLKHYQVKDLVDILKERGEINNE